MTTRARWFRQPEDLNETARHYWFLHGPGLIEDGLLSPNSADQFKSLCRILAAARIASAEIERFGVTIETAAGGRKSNPAVTALISAQKAMGPLLVAFNMTSLDSRLR